MPVEIERVSKLLGGTAHRGATPDEIARAERRLGIRLPDDIKELVTGFDGSDESTPVENGWITFWSMRAWHSVSDDAGATRGSRIPNGILFADHSIES